MEDREKRASDDQTARNDQRDAERRVETEQTDAEDVVSDPGHSDEVGADWSDEGGATPTGPATQSREEASDEDASDKDEREEDDVLPPEDLPAITLDPPD